jgi:hypothetical protein
MVIRRVSFEVALFIEPLWFHPAICRASADMSNVSRLILHDVEHSHEVATDDSPRRQPGVDDVPPIRLVFSRPNRRLWRRFGREKTICARCRLDPRADARGYNLSLLRSWFSRCVYLTSSKSATSKLTRRITKPQEVTSTPFWVETYWRLVSRRALMLTQTDR